MKFTVEPSVSLDALVISLSSIGAQTCTLVTVHLDRETAARFYSDFVAALATVQREADKPARLGHS